MSLCIPVDNSRANLDDMTIYLVVGYLCVELKSLLVTLKPVIIGY